MSSLAIAQLLLAAHEETLLLISSALMGLAAVVLADLLFGYDVKKLQEADGEVAGFEAKRRQRLRDGSSLYRSFQGLVEQLAERNRLADEAKRIVPAKQRPATRLEKLAQNLITAAEPLPWLAEEYLACRQIEAIGVAGVGILIGIVLFESIFAAAVLGAILFWGYQRFALRQTARRAWRRRKVIRQRLPYALDMMALMMEAGASFPECLTAVVNENKNHPLGKEFGEVLRETNLGRTRREALLALQQRLNDDDVAELVFALVKGEELGTPLAQTLRSQSTQLLLKQSQWIEKEAAEAQVMIVFPGMVVMVACLLIIVAPFLLNALYNP